MLHPSLVSFHSSSQKKLAWDPSALFLGRQGLLGRLLLSSTLQLLLAPLPLPFFSLSYLPRYGGSAFQPLLFFFFPSLPYRSLVRSFRNHDDNRQPRETRREKESERARTEREENERDRDRDGAETSTTLVNRNSRGGTEKKTEPLEGYHQVYARSVDLHGTRSASDLWTTYAHNTHATGFASNDRLPGPPQDNFLALICQGFDQDSQATLLLAFE